MLMGMNTPAASPPPSTEPRLTSLSHGGGCGCKIAPGVLSEILKGTTALPVPKELLVGIETSDDAAVYQLNDEQALIATTDFFMPIVDDPFDFGRIAATNAISDVYAMGGRPILALALVGMPINVLSTQTIARVLEGGASVCRAAGIPIAGGHTIDSVEAIYGLVALGLVHPRHVKRNADAQPGDVLILGKPLGVGVMSAALKKDQLGDEGYARMIATTTQLNTPGPDLAAAGRRGVQVIDKSLDDRLAEATSLVARIDGDVDDLKEQTAVADHASHADDSVVMTDHDRMARVRKAQSGAFSGLGAQAGFEPEPKVVCSERRLGMKAVALRQWRSHDGPPRLRVRRTLKVRGSLGSTRSSAPIE